MLVKFFAKFSFYFIELFGLEEAYIKIFFKKALKNFVLIVKSEEAKNSNILIHDLCLFYIYYLATYLPKSNLKQKIVLKLLEDLQRKAEWELKNN